MAAYFIRYPPSRIRSKNLLSAPNDSRIHGYSVAASGTEVNFVIHRFVRVPLLLRIELPCR
jgi:hypothetical protein